MTKQQAEYKTGAKSDPVSKSNFIPNSYQTPNMYVDAYLNLLTGEEWKTLSYAIRRILGFQKRSDRISLSQFSNGITDRDGNHLDYGCGLSVNTLRGVLKSLCSFGFLIRLQENDPVLNTGPEYGLQLDDSQINLSALLARDKTKTVQEKDRTKKAIRVMQAKRKQYPLMSDITPNVGRSTPPDVPRYRPPNVGREHNKQENQGNTELYTAEAISTKTVPQIKAMPEMKQYLKVTGMDVAGDFPGQYQWAKIVMFIHEHKPAEDVMRECWTHWAVTKGYRPNDITWLTEWTITGIPNKKNGNGHNGKTGKKKAIRGTEAAKIFRS